MTGVFDCDHSSTNENAYSSNGDPDNLQEESSQPQPQLDERFVTNEDSIERHFNYNPLYTGLHLAQEHEYPNDNVCNHEDKNGKGLGNLDEQQLHQQNRLIESHGISSVSGKSNNNNSVHNNNNNNAGNMQSCDTHNVLEDLHNCHNLHESTSRTSNGLHTQRGAKEHRPGRAVSDHVGGVSDENRVSNKQQQHCQSLEFAQHPQRRQQHSQGVDHRSRPNSKTLHTDEAEEQNNQVNNQPAECDTRNVLHQHQQVSQTSHTLATATPIYGSVQYEQMTSEMANNQCQTNNSARQRRRSVSEQGQQNQPQDTSGNTNSSQQQQQQQFLIASGVEGSEEMFSEFQNNSMPLGITEELQQLNHTINCDNETLEEQINMLSNEDFMSSSHVDQMDYHNFTSNDQFLNMLFSGANNQLTCTQSSSSTTNGLQQQPNGNLVNGSGLIHLAGSGPNKVNDGGNMGTLNSTSIDHTQKRQQDQSDNVSSSLQQQFASHLQDVSQNKSQVKNVATNRQTAIKKSTRNRKSTLKSPSGNRLAGCNVDAKNPVKSNKKTSSKTKGGPANRSELMQSPIDQVNASDHNNNNNNNDCVRITTANTNKRLMPKKTTAIPREHPHHNSVALRRETYVNNSCVTSPTSTSNTSNSSTLSPSSANNTNQLAEHENSYKVQLDKLRKKLKMDVAPTVVSSQSPPPQTMGRSPSQSLHHQNSTISLIPPATADHLMADQFQDVSTYEQQQHQLQRHQMPIQVLVRNDTTNCNSSNLQVQATNSDLARFRSNQQQTLSSQSQINDTLHVHKQSPMGAANNNPSTYVLAKPLQTQPLDACNQAGTGGGTIYLSTSSGLMQVTTQAQHHQMQQTGVSAYSVGGQMAQPIPLSAPLIFSCLGQRRGCITKGMDTQGPTGVIYQQVGEPSQKHEQQTGALRPDQQSIQNGQTVLGTTQELIFSGDDIKNFVDTSTGSQNLIRHIQNSEPMDRLQHGINMI